MVVIRERSAEVAGVVDRIAEHLNSTTSSMVAPIARPISVDGKADA
jgi:hypothetical protein